MKIRKLQNEDENLLEKFLSDYAETSMFLRSNLRASGCDYKDGSFHGEYFGSFTSTGEINGVIAHYWNGNIMTQAINDVVLNHLIQALRENITRPVAGVVGSSNLSDVVIKSLGFVDKDFMLNRDEGLYALDLLNLILPNNFSSIKYRMVDVKEVDKSVLVRWIKGYEIEAFGAVNDEDLDAHVQSRVDEMINGKDCWVLLDENQPVSLSGFNARLPDIVQVGPVWTPPEYRSNGYARILVSMSLQKALKEGVKKSILFTDNQAAIKCYESIGFQEVDTYRLAILKKPIEIGKVV